MLKVGVKYKDSLFLLPMTKLVVLKLDGDLHEGVRVTLSIAFEGTTPYKEVTGNLPPVAPLQTTIDEWRTHYHSLGNNNRTLTAKKVTYSGSIAQKQESCKNLAIQLQRRLNTWLFSKSFRPIRETWLKELHESDAVRVLIRTSNQQLRQIPWHLWDLIEEYPNVELALSATDYQKPTEPKTASIRDKVKILAILGNSNGIDVETDQKLLNSLPDTDVTFLVTPQRHEINDSLWEKPLLGVTIETGLAERILKAVGTEPGDLPLLEFALTQLWTKQHRATLTHTDYDEIGGLEAALARYADSVYDKLNFEEKERAQRIFIQLVHPGERTESTRRVATSAEVGEENWDLVTRLANARLVVTGHDEKTGLDTVEVVHEALIRSWRQLQQWMQLDREFRCGQEQLRVAIRTWESSGFDEGALNRRKPLADAEYWQSQRFLELSLGERSFIELSVELRERELKKHKRRRQITISGLVSGLVLALILTLIAIKQWQKASISEINTFRSSAETLLP